MLFWEKIPYAVVQADGRPDLTALAHLTELPLYLLAAWLLIGAYGAKGAAIAWTLRILSGFNDPLVFWLSVNYLGWAAAWRRWHAWWPELLALCTLIAAAEPPALRMLLGGLSAVSLILAARLWVIHPGELRQLRRHFTAPGV